MSGFEIAGVVLGAFPIAVSALDGYRRVARKAKLYVTIRAEHTKCEKELKFHELALKRHLRQLLLPIVSDNDRVSLLLAHPAGEGWKDARISRCLEERLGDSYETYLGYVVCMGETLEKLKTALAFDCDAVQEKLDTPAVSASMAGLKGALSKENGTFQLYKLKFANGESIRRRLFDELADFQAKLEQLLDSSDKDADLVQKMAVARRASAVDTALCNFWRTATAFFRALAAACLCQCRDRHAAELLLQYRVAGTGGEKPGFHVRFTTEVKSSAGASTGSTWKVCETRIVEGDDGELVKKSVVMLDKTTISLPGHRKPVPKAKAAPKAAIRSMTQASGLQKPRARFLNQPPSVLSTSPSPDPLRPISTLCESLADPGYSSCHGYLRLPNDDRRYYVFSVAQHDYVPTFVTLAQIINGDVKPPPTRTQRCVIALIVASSFLQLQDSPWLPSTHKTHSLDKTSIVFHKDSASPHVFPLDQPHIRRPFAALAAAPASQASSIPSSFYSCSLPRLGITLLELCFSCSLESQPCRARYPPVDSEHLSAVYDNAAAHEWLEHVTGEAGIDYSAAVAWCLLGHKVTPADRWREAMLREVIAPLQRCLDYLLGTGVPTIAPALGSAAQ
ncbi:hypothetical protein MAPG_04080 [Magnaporthiopsis poae ATCC 64411]|uniref:DUF7580 domain-containing protein n=1 Tax=Magnaporthiopsis poae (strain ATCC 64411 / 73-15) TaxID=644358 RepID=A0A0C4DVR9_MAGP6|nr:hypothetical protein MAPG_04080 [Magnaporthiopsis poae ATCC 64411]